MITKRTAETLMTGISSVIKGKSAQIELFTATFLAGGHVLLEDVPGLGKTTLAKTLAHLVASGSDEQETEGDSSSFKRIQFTPDLLPYDITGVDIFNPQEHRFDFVPGPVFCDILLADEINRTTPKVQSALLEVMQEKHITTGGKTRKVSDLFFVVATQNPIETEGTYPLPAAQLDRFMMRLSLGYPDEENEMAILMEDPSETVLPSVKAIVSKNEILESRKEQKSVFCHPALARAIIAIVRETRANPAFRLGVSPRGSLLLLHAARSLALVRGRTWIEDNDIIDLAGPVLAHRIISNDFRTDVPKILGEIVSATLRKVEKKTDWSKELTADDPAHTQS